VILVEGIRLGASRATLLRMAGNVACERRWSAPSRCSARRLRTLCGKPISGTLRCSSGIWRAARAARADRSFVLLIICGVVALALGLLALGILLTRWAVHALGAL